MIISDDGKTVYDPKTNLIWDRQGSKNTMTFDEAIVYAETANSKKHLGIDGWRVPEIHELLSIVDFTEKSPAINSVIFPECKCLFYWSSTYYKDSPANAWNINFNNGKTDANNKSYNNFFVRLVRSGH